MTTPITLHVDAFGRLVVVCAGETFVDVTPIRAFPLTDPDRWISFVDATGHEVASVEDVSVLSAADRARLAAELARREFFPEIRRLRDISAGAEPTTWRVDTDRGEVRFELPSEDHVRRLGRDGALVTDAHGVRYRIASVAALDAHGRRLLRRYL